MIHRALLSVLLIVSVLTAAIAQQPAASPQSQKPATPPPAPPQIESQDVVRITTNLVQIDAVVTKDGKHVTDLKPEDFELFEDGRRQTITNFSYIWNVPATPSTAAALSSANYKDKTATPVPPAVVRPNDVRRTIALVVDDLGMSYQSMVLARRQLRKFVDEQLQPNDLVAIIRTSGEVGALQQFTTERRMIYNAIDRLRLYPCSRPGVYVFPPVGSPETFVLAPCGGALPLQILTTLRKLKFIVGGMRDLPGRKSLVLFTDDMPIEKQEPGSSDIVTGGGGFYRNDYSGQLRKIAELAIRSSVVIYAVDTRGLAHAGLEAADNFGAVNTMPRKFSGDLTDQMNSTVRTRTKAMIALREGSQLIARETGGYLVYNSNDFKLKEIAEDQQGYYLLGYRPSEKTFNEKFHQIKVALKRKGLTVRTRTGFFGVDAARPETSELTPGNQMKKALMSPFGAGGITLRLTTMFTNLDSGSLLRSFLYINPQDLVFVEEPGGLHVAKFDLGVILFGENGQINDTQNRGVAITLRDDAYQSALRHGIVHSFDTALKKAGAFQFRVAIRDQKSGHIGSAGQFIEIPNLGDGRLALSGLMITRETHDKSAGASLSSPDTQDAITSGQAVRQFRAGGKLIFAYSIYNAHQDRSTHLPQLTTQIRVFRDGKDVFTGTPIPVEIASRADLKRIPSLVGLEVDTEFPPGEYIFQVIVTDKLAKEKQQIASQWIDFEIVK